MFCHVTGSTRDFRPPKTSADNTSCTTISGGRTEQHVVIGFGDLAAVD